MMMMTSSFMKTHGDCKRNATETVDMLFKMTLQ